MHSIDQVRKDAKVTKYQTVDAIEMVRAAVAALGALREIEMETDDGELRIKVRVKAY